MPCKLMLAACIASAPLPNQSRNLGTMKPARSLGHTRLAVTLDLLVLRLDMSHALQADVGCLHCVSAIAKPVLEWRHTAASTSIESHTPVQSSTIVGSQLEAM